VFSGVGTGGLEPKMVRVENGVNSSGLGMLVEEGSVCCSEDAIEGASVMMGCIRSTPVGLGFTVEVEGVKA
jgi:hypothetical protein